MIVEFENTLVRNLQVLLKERQISSPELDTVEKLILSTISQLALNGEEITRQKQTVRVTEIYISSSKEVQDQVDLLLGIPVDTLVVSLEDTKT